MDIVDDAELKQERLLEAEIARISAEAHKPIVGTGECWNCGEPVEPGRRWCCADCRDQWEAEQNKRR